MMSDQKCVILNVDDKAAPLSAKSRMLRQAGYEVIEAQSGAAALRFVSEAHPSLVLLSAGLPDLSGGELCRRIRPEFHSAPPLILQCETAPGAETEGEADLYLREPVEAAELLTAVRTLERLRRAEERYRRLFESNPHPMWVFDTESLRFLAVNEAAIYHYGYSRDEFLNMTIREIRPPEEVTRLLSILSTAEPVEFNVAGEWTHRKKDGALIQVEITSAALSFDGRPARLVLASDITERKRVELERQELLRREREARAEAEAATRARDEFLALVSHELRTPLSAMLGWARILRTRKPLDQTQAHAVEIIERSARTQSQLIEDLLDVSRIITGKLRLSVSPLELSPVICAACEVLRPAAEAKQLDLRLMLDPAAGVITGDPERLQQVVWNLVSNAIRFTPSGGRVEIRLERVDPNIRITVSDTGQGISPEFLPCVFERFRQADVSATRRQGGLGLGLSLARHLVELHGGTISAESAGENQGATFRVNLPMRAIRPQTEKTDSILSQAAANLSGLLAGLKILVVDDEADARELVATVLAQYDAEVVTAASVAEAMQVFLSHPRRPDVLVSDIGMPVEDGYALISRVRALPPEQGGELPAVALTAWSRMQDRLRALATGFQTHVPKPIEPEELATVIAALTGRLEKSLGVQSRSFQE